MSSNDQSHIVACESVVRALRESGLIEDLSRIHQGRGSDALRGICESLGVILQSMVKNQRGGASLAFKDGQVASTLKLELYCEVTNGERLADLLPPVVRGNRGVATLSFKDGIVESPVRLELRIDVPKRGPPRER